MNYNEIIDDYENYILPTYPKSDLLLVKGEGSFVFDNSGKRYIDFTCGIGVCNIGHCHKDVARTISEQALKLVHVSNLYMNEKQPLLAKKISEASFKGKVFFANSGAEANEGMIKFARKWGNARNKNLIIIMRDSFHGRTLATLAATGRKKYREGFEPETDGFVEVQFNNFEQIELVYKKAEGKISAILMEPIQGEGGIIPAEKEYLEKVRTFCDEKEILLMFDEVQTGIGRTGEYFSFKHYRIQPDLMSMAKGLGNGFPIAAFIVNSRIENVLTPGTHASTFGGTPLACSAAISVLEAIESEKMLENSRRMSEFAFKELRKLQNKYNSIEKIRGVGLMIGVVVNVPTGDILRKARENGLLLISAGENVIRFYPQLNVQKDVLIEALNIFENVISSCEQLKTNE